MKSTIISNNEMSNIVALCACNGTKISLHDNGDSISAEIPSWGREYESFYSCSTTPIIKAYVGVLINAKKALAKRRK